MTTTALRRPVRPSHSSTRDGRSAQSCDGIYSAPLLKFLLCLIAGGYLLGSPALAQDSISINDVTVTEGNAGPTAFNFTVARSTNTAAFSLNWATANGTAAQPSDYATAGGTLNFTAGGSLTQTVTVLVNGDTTPEPNETFLVNLSALTITSGIAALADAQGTGTITNDEPNTPPTGTIANQTAAAGAAFSFTPAAFTDPEGGTLTYAATRADDSPLPAWLSFNPATRQFTGTPTVAENGVYAIKVTVTDNGTPPLSGSATFNITVGHPVTVTTAAVTEGNSGTVTMTFTVTRTVADTEFTVNYAASGTAASGTDYVAVPNGTLTFTAGGALVQTIDVTVNGDTAIEANETVILTLSGIVNTTGITVVGGTPASGTITNDDFVPSRFPASGALTSTMKGTIDLDVPPLTGGAEIPAFEPVTKRAFTSSNTGVQVIDLTNPATPAFITTIVPATLGVAGLTSNDVSSVAIRKAAGANPAVLAAAVIASPKTNFGHVIFLNPATGALLGSALVGANPDHVAFTPDGTKLLVAIEAETLGNAELDTSAGGVAILNLSGGVVAPPVTTAGFAAWDAQAAALTAAGVRLFPGTKPSTDFEPEYFAIAPDGATAMVTLQEANAVAILNIATATFTEIIPLGKKNFALGEYDFSDRDGAGGVALALPRSGQPVYGLYLPDAIAAYSSGGQTYYVTANEGDDRNDFITPAETTTVGAVNYDLDNTVFPNEAALKNLASLGRLTVCNVPGLRGDTDNDGDIDEILSYGGRSFSILDFAGQIVFDSGDMLENIMASQFLSNFDDTRSDNKGPEPEGVTVVTIGTRVYAFLSLERSHMVVVFDVTNPVAVQFVGGLRNAGDMNPEGSVFVPPADSPTGQALLLVANEVSQSLTIYELAVDNVSIDDVTVTEGNAGTTAFNFTVTRPTNTAAFSLNWATANGTAAQPADYTTASGTLNFTAGGSLTETVTVLVNGDTTPEPNETFFVNLSALTITSGIATLADAQGRGTITNDEPNAPPTGTIPNQSTAIGVAFSFTPAAFTDPEAGTLSYAATRADDSPLPAWLSFNPATRQFTGTPAEADIAVYSIKVTATDDGAPPLSGSATFTLTVGRPVTVTAATVTEGHSGTVTMVFTVTRTVPDSEFTVNYAVTGTATSGTDYVAVPNGTLTFTAGGALVQTIDIIVNGDTAIEANETVILTLSGIVNTTGITVPGGTGAATGTITNDDVVPSRFPASGALTSTMKGTIDLDVPPLTGGAEIPAFEPVTKRAFTSSNSGVQVIDLTNPAAPAFITTIAPATLGVAGLTSNDVSSVAVRKAAGANPAVLAAAVIASPKTNFGHVIFLNPATGALLGSALVGANPDHVAFTPDGTKLLVAIEGETLGNAELDTSAGGVAILNLSGGVLAPPVATAGFAAWDAQAAALTAAGVRLFPGTKPSTDFEPEYFAIAANGATAMVTLQEANAVAILNIATATFTEIIPLGKKNFALGEYDFSDRDGAGGVALALPRSGQPVYGLYLPDAIASYSSGGQTYYVTANEGDDRNDFITPAETTTVGAANYDLDNTVFPNETALKNLASLGRLTVCNVPGLRGDTDNDGDIDEILSYGGRSFSILDSAGHIVFDSGDMLENIMASQFLANFDDTRSDNKGPEPEGVTVVTIGARVYAFLSLERSHMVVVFDVTNPAAVQFVGGLRNAGDMNPEGSVYVSPADSPTGKALLLVANEVSQSLTIYELEVDNISINDVTVTEGNAGTTAFNFTVTRSTNTAAFSLNWATANGTAAQPSDYATASGTLNFTAGGSLTETVTVNVNGDTTSEPNETFLVNLSALTITSGIATLADAQGTGTITNDEPNTPPAGTIANQTAAAGAAFSFTPAAFTDAEGGTLTYAATRADDSPLPAWLSFNSATRQFTGTPTVAEIGVYAIKVTATDNGTPPLSGSATFNITVGHPVTVTAASVTEGNSGTVTMTFTVTRTVADTDFSVNYAASGTATSGTDYVAVPNGTLTFTAGGALVQTIDVTVNGDTAIEANETVILTLSGIVNTTGITVVGSTPASGTITNDDFVPSRFPASGALTSTMKGFIDLDAPPLTGGAEIPAFEPVTKRAFTSSNSGVQVIDLTNPAAPAFITTIVPATLGVAGLTSNDVSSVAIRKAAGANPAVLAAAVIASPKTNFGHVIFLNPATGALLGSAQVGANPDHVAFSPDGTKLLVAIEGETLGNADLDTTAGGVAILNLAAGLAAPTVTTAGFAAWDAQVAALTAAGVRLFPGTKPSTDFEPEYFAIAPDGATAMVTLQEANAVAILNIATATFTEIIPLGKKNFAPGEYDFSDRDGAGGVALALPRPGQPVYGLYMPDAIAAYSSGGQTYYVTANEGDDRNDFITPAETTTVGAVNYDLDDTVFPNEAALKNLASLGRLTVCNVPGLRGDTDGDGDIDEILSYGGRSFSILNSAGQIVFDSGDMLENIMASQFLSNFDDTRSDNKGPEPEGVTVVTIGTRVYAFLSLERSHMVVVFDVTNPAAVQFVGGLRNAGDMNPEGSVFVSPADSPTGKALLLVANEVSQSLTIYELAPLIVTPAPDISVLDGAAVLTDSQVAPVAFGPTMLLRNRTRTLTIRNDGGADLTGITADIDGPNAALFTVTTAPAGTVAAGVTTPLIITFTPPSPGTFTANLHIHSNDADEEPFDLVLTASGAPNAALSSLTINPDALLPTFTPDTTTLFSSYVNSVTSVILTPTLMDPAAALAIRFNGAGAFTAITSGSPTAPFALVEGSSRVEFRVTASDNTTTQIYTVNLNRAPLVFTSANRDVFLPNTRESNPQGITLGGTQFINLGLQGVGRVPGASIDPATGESLGSISDMQISNFVKNGDGSYSGTMTTLPDRGYNAVPPAVPVNVFSNYAARLNNYTFTFTPYTAAAPTTAQNQIAMTFTGSTRFTYDHDGNAGTPPVFTTGMLANGGTTLFGTTVPIVTGNTTQSDGTVANRLTVDSEGLVLDTRPGKAGTGWVGDEYGAYIYHFNASKQIDGVLKEPDALIPHGPVGTVNFLVDPPLNGRRINQGMEGLCQSPDGTLLFGMLQSATIQDSGSGNQGRTNARLLVYDITGNDVPADPVAQYVIQLPRFDSDVALLTGAPGLDRAGAQSSIIALNNHQLLVLSRDGNGRGAVGAPMFKSVLLVELTGATNFDGQFDGEGVDGKLTSSGDVLKPGITPMTWIEALNMLGKTDPSVADLAKFNMNLNTAPGDINSLSEKWEALALVSCQDPANPDDYFLFMGNDNDFGSATGKYKDAAGVLQTYDTGFENDTVVLAWRVRLNPLPDVRVHNGATTATPFIADGQAAPVSVGVLNPGLSVSRTYTIHNNGNSPLILNDPPVTIDGPQAAEFVLTSPPSLTTLPPGATTTFTIQFTPATTGNRNAAVHISGNGPGATASYDFPVRGVGNTPPVAPPQTFVRGSGLTLKIKLSDILAACSDGEAGTLSVTSFGASAQGATLTTTATHLLYVSPNENADSFTYAISDGQGGSAGNTITIQVVPQQGAVANSVLLPGGGLRADFSGIPGLSYTIERSTNLMTWTAFSTVTAPANGLFSITDNEGLSSAFYRLRYNP